jgi:Uma2 family endonuclease
MATKTKPGAAAKPPVHRRAADRMADILVRAMMDIGDDTAVMFTGMCWAHYRKLLRARDRRRPAAKVTFDRGRLEVVTVASLHEQWKKTLAMLIECLAEEFGLPLVPVGNVTVAREDLDRGFEPDECYYIQNAARVVGVTALDFERDPPPDLAVEIEKSRTIIDRLPLYAAVGVPELWRYNGDALIVLRLRAKKTYRPVAVSPTFPAVPLARIEQALQRVGTTDIGSIVREFRAWVKTVVPPTA